VTSSATQPDIPVGIALPGLVIAIALIGDALIYVVLPLYHQEFGLSLAMVGVLLSLNRWIRLLANSAVALLGERIGPHALMIAAAAGSIVSTSLYGLADSAALQVVARCLWGISFAALNLSSLAYAVADRANAGKRVGLVRALIGVVQIMALVGGAWLVLEVGSRQVFVIFGAITSLALLAALLLPRLPPEPTSARGFKLPIPHKLEIWGFMLGFAGDGVFLLTLAFLMKDSITMVAPVMATAILLALRWTVEITTGPLAGWIGDRFGARQLSIAGRGLLCQRRRPRGDRRGAGGDHARHVQHPDPGAGDRQKRRGARQGERALLTGQLLDLARLRRRGRAAERAVAVPERGAGTALRGAGGGVGDQCVVVFGAAVANDRHGLPARPALFPGRDNRPLPTT
jgi:MFS family permease